MSYSTRFLGSLRITVPVMLLGLALCLPGGSVHAADLTYSADTTIQLISPSIQFVIAAGSSANSVVVNSGTVVITVPAGSAFTLYSASRGITTSPGVTTQSSLTCEGGLATLAIGTGNTIDQTITITPEDAACTATSVAASPNSGGGGGGTGGGGGGGSSYSYTPTPTATPSAPLTLQDQLTALLAKLVTLQTQAKGAATGGTPTVTGDVSLSTPPSGSFKKLLSAGSSGADVTALQNFLKSQGTEIYPEGTVSGYFGGLTKKAVKNFQLKYGITTAADSAFGLVGPKTRAKINSILGLPR